MTGSPVSCKELSSCGRVPTRGPSSEWSLFHSSPSSVIRWGQGGWGALLESLYLSLKLKLEPKFNTDFGVNSWIKVAHNRRPSACTMFSCDVDPTIITVVLPGLQNTLTVIYVYQVYILTVYIIKLVYIICFNPEITPKYGLKQGFIHGLSWVLNNISVLSLDFGFRC